MITRENYELFYMDYLEGDLAPDLVKELEAFLVLHPDLKVEDDFLAPIQGEEIIYDKKDDLKFEALPAFEAMKKEDQIIAYHEGILTPAQEKEVLAWVKANSAQDKKEFEDYKKVYLTAPVLNYGNKKQLKRRGTIVMWPMLTAAAASVALLFFFNVDQSEGPTHAFYQPKTIDVNLPETTLTQEDEELPILSISTDNPLVADATDLKTLTKGKTKKEPKGTTQANPSGTSTDTITKVTTQIPIKNTTIPFEERNITPRTEISIPKETDLNPSRNVVANKGMQETKMEDILPPLMNYAVQKVSQKASISAVELKKEENKSLFKGKFNIKIGRLELSKK